MLAEFQIRKLNHLFRIIDFDHNGLLQKSDFEGIADNIAIFTGIIGDREKDSRLRDEATRIWEFITAHFANEHLEYLEPEQWIEFMQVHFFGPDEALIDQNIHLVVKHIQEVFDKNRDVQISRLEFMSIFVSFRVEVRFADQCFKAIDTNGDGFISEDELINAAMEFFKSNEPEASGNLLFGELESSLFVTRRTFY